MSETFVVNAELQQLKSLNIDFLYFSKEIFRRVLILMSSRRLEPCRRPSRFQCRHAAVDELEHRLPLLQQADFSVPERDDAAHCWEGDRYGDASNALPVSRAIPSWCLKSGWNPEGSC